MDETIVTITSVTLKLRVLSLIKIFIGIISTVLPIALCRVVKLTLMVPNRVKIRINPVTKSLLKSVIREIND